MTLAALCLAIALAAAVQLVSGFGFALVAAPILVAFTDPVTSVSVLAVLGAVVSALALTTSREPLQILRRESAGLLAWAVPGLVAGALVIDRLPDDAVRAAVGALVLAALVQRRRRGPESRSDTSANPGPRRGGGVGLVAAGATAGAMSTSTALNGPPLVLYLTARNASPRGARDTLALLFLVLDVASVGALAAVGSLELPVETLALPAAGLLGVLAGHAIFDRLTHEGQARAITTMLVVAALTAVGAAIA